MSQQSLCTGARGRVFHDGLGRLNAVREKIRWYPTDVWIHLLARQVVELMRLCFLMEKRYWPYNKWFGSAFSELDCSRTVLPILTAALESSTWKDRERHLNRAYVRVAELHNNLCITGPVDPSVSHFHSRPYLVIHANRFVAALWERLDSTFLKSIKRCLRSAGMRIPCAGRTAASTFLTTDFRLRLRESPHKIAE